MVNPKEEIPININLQNLMFAKLHKITIKYENPHKPQTQYEEKNVEQHREHFKTIKYITQNIKFLSSEKNSNTK